jgi:Leucine-rich repeat (LRR) protein
MKCIMFALACLCVILVGGAPSSAGNDDELKKALDAINRAGGYVGHDRFKTPRHLLISYATKDINAVVNQLKYFKEIESIACIGHVMTDDVLMKCIVDAPGLKRLEASGMTDEGLRIISRAKNLEYLKIASLRMTDVGLKHLAALDGLRELHIGGAQFTSVGFMGLKESKRLDTLSYVCINDECLKGIAKLDSIRTLDLTAHIKGGISDKGLLEVGGMKNLQRLILHRAQITDKDVKRLAVMEALQYLDLSQTDITDQALKTVGKLKKLTGLRLDKTQVGDGGLAHLRCLENLRVLDLQNTMVTDQGILQLAQLKNLRVLSIGGTAVTPDGRSQFSRVNNQVSIRDAVRPLTSKD